MNKKVQEIVVLLSGETCVTLILLCCLCGVLLDGMKNYENDDENESDNGSTTGIDRFSMFIKKLKCLPCSRRRLYILSAVAACTGQTC